MEPTITPPITTPVGLWLLPLSDVATGVVLLFEVLEEGEEVVEIGKMGEEAVELGEFAFKQATSSEFPTSLVLKSV